MSDVNLNSLDQTPRPSSGEPRPARASSSTLAEGSGNNSSSVKRSTGVEEVKQSRAQVAQERAEDRLDDLNSAVTQLNDFVQTVQRDLEFEVDDDSGRTIVRVIDQRTDQVIRQIPDEMALRLAENLKQDEPLVLLNIRV